MLMNYHELTMTESRDSPARRQQFLLICTIMAAAMIHSIIQAGGLESVTVEDGIFPGGDFIYKETKRDYAASASLEKLIGKIDAELEMGDFIDRIYTIYLDDPNTMGGRQQRFASGYLMNDNNNNNNEKNDMIEKLLQKNVGKTSPTESQITELGAIELWPLILYMSSKLPQVKAATVQFAYTGGFVSAIIFNMKILPTLRKYAKEHSPSGNPITIVSTCSTVDNVCTHYAPLSDGISFLLGHDDTETYLNTLEPQENINLGAIFRSLKKSIPPIQWIMDLINNQNGTTTTNTPTTNTTPTTIASDQNPQDTETEEMTVKELKSETIEPTMTDTITETTTTTTTTEETINVADAGPKIDHPVEKKIIAEEVQEVTMDSIEQQQAGEEMAEGRTESTEQQSETVVETKTIESKEQQPEVTTKAAATEEEGGEGEEEEHSKPEVTETKTDYSIKNDDGTQSVVHHEESVQETKYTTPSTSDEL